MEKTYHILRVYDYKGGELGTSLNLDYESFIEELPEKLDFYVFINENDEFQNGELEPAVANENAYLKAALDSGELMEWIDNSRSRYGGGDNCWFLYECENNTMSEFSLTHAVLSQAVDIYIKYSE